MRKFYLPQIITANTVLRTRSYRLLLILVLAFGGLSQSNAQSCLENNIGFNAFIGTKTLTVCQGNATSSASGAKVESTLGQYEWQVSSSATGTFTTVSPDPGNVENWPISANYYNTPGVYYFRRVVTNTTACNGPSDVITFTVTETPTINTVSNQSLCNGGSTAAVNFSGTGTGTVYNWTNSNSSIGLAASGSGNIGAFTAINTGTSPVTATITVTPRIGTCDGTPISFDIVVNPTPTVNSQADLEVCNGAPTTSVSFGGTISGTTYNWTNSNTSIGLGGSGTGTIATFTAINTTGAPIVATITVTPTIGGCDGTPKTFTITVDPTPTVTNPGNQALCRGLPTTAINFSGNVTGTTYNWTNDNTGIGLASNGTGNINSFTAANSGSAPIVATIEVTPTVNGCDGTPVSFTITVNPTPNVNAVSNQALCQGSATTAINFSGSVGSTTYNWTNSNTGIGLAANGTGNIGSFTASNSGNTAIIATITVTPTVSGCDGTPVSFTITVNPTPTVTDLPDQNLCKGSNTNPLNFSGNVPGTTFNWVNDNTAIGLGGSGSGDIPAFTANNAGSTTLTATITVTPSVNGCPGTPQTIVISVDPTPTINNPGNQEVCNTTATAGVNFTGAVGGTTYNWTNSAPSIGLAASGSGDITSFTGLNTTNAPVTGLITVTPTASGCGATPITFTITVNPTATVVKPADQSVCKGEATIAVNFSGNVPGADYNWTNNTPAIGLAASGTGNIGSFPGVNTGTTTSNATITVVPGYNGCPGPSQSFVIAVDPTPTLTNPGNQSICNGTSTAAVNFSGTVSATVFNWTNSTPSIGLPASGSGNIGSFTGINTGTTDIVATITVTPAASECEGTPTVFTITVKPTPSVVAPANVTACNGTNTSVINFSGNVPGTVYNWTNTTPGIGLAASGAGSLPAFTATNASAAPVVATITVTPTINGCGGTPVQFTITVNPTPTIAGITNQVICNGTSTTTVSFSGPVAGTTYNWVNNTTSIGLGANGTGDIAAFTGTNATVAPVTATITVTPNVNSCAGTGVPFTIRVNPTPTVGAVTNKIVCNNGPVAAVNFTGTAGPTYNWTNSAPTIGLAASGTGNSIGGFTAINTGTIPVVATITVTPAANGCNGTPITYTITVNPTSSMTVPANQSVCKGAPTTAISFTGTTGATYAWTNNNTAIGLAASGTGDIASFTALNTGTTAITSTISVTPSANGCPATAPTTFTITVNPAAAVTNITGGLCSGSTFSITPLNGTNGSIPAGTTFTWPTPVSSPAGAITGGSAQATGVTTISQTLTNTIAGQAWLTYTITPTTGGCAGATFTLTDTVGSQPPATNISWYQFGQVDYQGICDGNVIFSTNDIDIIPQPGNNSYDNAGYQWEWEYATGNATVPTGPWTTSPGTTTTFYQHVLPPPPSLFSPIGDYYFRFSLSQNGCTTYSDVIHLAVSSTLKIDAGGPFVKCYSATPAPITLTGASVTGTASTTVGGSWSIIQGGGTLSSTAQTANPAAITYTPAVGFTGLVKLQLISNDPDGSGPCLPVRDTCEITILPLGNLQGCIAPANWAITQTNGNGSIDGSQAPCAVTLNGPDNNSGTPGKTEAVLCSGAGNFSFNWVFTAPPSVGAVPVWADQTVNTGVGAAGAVSFIANKPSTVVAGDLIIVILHARDNIGSTTAPDGFSLIRRETSGTNGTNNRGTVITYWKIAGASEPATYAFRASSMGIGEVWVATTGRVTGADQTSPIDVNSGISNTGTPISITIPALTTTGGNRLLIAAVSVADDDHGTIPNPSTMTTLANGLSASGDQITYGSARVNQAATGGSISPTFSWSNGDPAAAQMFAIKPALIADDSAYVIVNGVATLVSGTTGSSGVFSKAVNTGDQIGFRMTTRANSGGAGKLTFYNVTVPNDAPVVTGLATIPPACNPATPTNLFVAPTATDNCGNTPTLVAGYPQTGAEVINGCGKTQTRTWLYVDNCGTQSQPFTQTISWTVDAIAPTLNIPGPTLNLCLVSGNLYTIPVASTNDNCVTGATISWSITGVTTRSGTGNDASGLFNPGTSTITWTSTDACGNATVKATTVNVAAGPTAVISGTTSICSGVSTMITVTLTGVGPWSITYNNGGAPVTVTGIATSPYTFSVSPAGTTTYTLTDMSASNCSGAVSGSAVITVKQSPTAVISGNATICSGAAATLSIAPTGTQPWSVTYTDGVTPVTVTGITTSPYTFPVSPTANTTYTITALNDANCVGTFSGSALVQVNPRPTVVVNPPSAAICVGGTATLTASGASTYSWTPSAGLSSTNIATVVANPATTTTYTVTGTNGFTCSATANVTVTVNTPPVTTGTTICQGSTGTLTSATSCAGGSFTSGPFNPTVAVTDNTGGFGVTAWTSVNNVLAPVGTPYATVTTNTNTQYIKATGYGFAIPASATITGISVTVNRRVTTATATVNDQGVRILKAGAIVGPNFAGGAGIAYPATAAFGTATYGSSSYLWATGWTAADINSATFGVSYGARSNGSSRTLELDYIQISVSYTLAGSLDWYTVSSGGSTIGSGTPFNPVGVAGSGLANTNTAGTTIYYAECSTAPGCRSATNFVIDPAASGTLASALLCSGASGVLTLSGSTGAIQEWQSSPDGISWTPIANTTTSQSYSNVTQPIKYRVKLNSGTCSSGYSDTASLDVHNLWLGNTSIDWNNNANWSGGVAPSNSCPDVIIPGGRPFQPTLATGTATINNLVIQPGGYLTVTAGKLQIAGTVTNTGSFNASAGTLEFNGSSTQNIAGNMFVTNTVKNLIMSNTNSLVVSSTQGKLLVTGDLSFGNVNGAVFNTGDNLVLASNATGTARVADLTNNGVNSGNSFSGRTTVERYFPARRSWRLLTSPLSNTGNIFNSWQAGAPGTYVPGKGMFVSGPNPTGSGGNGLDFSNLNNYSMKGWDANAGDYTNVGNTITQNLSNNGANAANLGFYTFVRGDRNRSPDNTIFGNTNNTTLSSTGFLQTGTQTFNFTSGAGSYAIVGNPYASSVDFNKITKNNVNPKRFYVYDASLGQLGLFVTMEDFGGTGTFTPSTPVSSIQRNHIQSSQAFFVEVTGANPSVVFNESDKSNNYNPALFRPMSPNAELKTLRANLLQVDNNDSTLLVDGIYSQFDESFNDAVDIQDALKFSNINENLALIRNGKILSVERRPLLTLNDTMFLRLTRTTQRKYRLEFAASKISENNLAGFVDDKFLGKLTPLNMNSTTRVDFEVTGDAASAARDRFKVIFKRGVTYTRLQGEVLNNDIALGWDVSNEFNVKSYEVERSLDGVNFTKVATKPALNSGTGLVSYNWLDVSPAPGYYYYRLHSTTFNEVSGYSDTVAVKLNKTSPSLYVVPNPVTDNLIHLQMNNMPAGVYHLRLLNSLGQAVVRNVVTHAPGTATETLTPKFRLVSGIYQLEVAAPGKKITTIKVIVK